MNFASKIVIILLLFPAYLPFYGQDLPSANTWFKRPVALPEWNPGMEKIPLQNLKLYQLRNGYSGQSTSLQWRSLPKWQEPRSFFCDLEDLIGKKIRIPLDLGPQ